MSFYILPFAILLILWLLKSSVTEERLVKLKPSDTLMECIGGYVICTTIIGYVSEGFFYWYFLQFITAIALIGYAIDAKQEIPSWKIGHRWLISVVFCLPLHVLWSWLGLNQPPSIFRLVLSATHLNITLLVLPLYISIKLVASVLLVIFYAIYNIGLDQFSASVGLLTSLLGLSLMVCCMIAYNKCKLAGYTYYGYYLNNTAAQPIKVKEQSPEGFGLYSGLEAGRNHPKETRAFIEQTMQEVTQLISYLDNQPLYKEDLDLIIKNFVVWDVFLKQRARSKHHIVLMPVEVKLDTLIQQLKVGLELGHLEYNEIPIPKLCIEYKDDKLPDKIICDVHQMICLLIPIILSMDSLDASKDGFVRMQFYTTDLKYASMSPAQAHTCFPAIALVISNSAVPSQAMPTISGCYRDVTVGSELHWNSDMYQEFQCLSVEQPTIEQIVRMHYGYLQFPSTHIRPMLIVVPCNAAAVRDEMISRILPSNVSITYREFKASMVTLTHAYNNLCTVAGMRTIVLDELFLLVRRCYGFRRHASGQLFYVRALAIAQLVAEWEPYQSKYIYCSLFYDLVCYAGLPLAYVRANYSIEIYSFVESIVSLHTRQEMEPCGCYIDNRLEYMINREQLLVLCIKFAERLYDLRHAKDYIHLEEVKYMVQETLTIDIELGKKYLNAKIVDALVEAAHRALQVCEGTC